MLPFRTVVSTHGPLSQLPETGLGRRELTAKAAAAHGTPEH